MRVARSRVNGCGWVTCVPAVGANSMKKGDQDGDNGMFILWRSYLGEAAKGAPTLVVAGPSVFICRDCVGLCIDVMAQSDPVWRDQKIEALSSLRAGKS